VLGEAGDSGGGGSRFAQLVEASAWSIEERQAHDSIPIVDALRSALRDAFGTMITFEGYGVENEEDEDEGGRYHDDDDDDDDDDDPAGGAAGGRAAELSWRMRQVAACVAALGLGTATGSKKGAKAGVLAVRADRAAGRTGASHGASDL
jgi:hypothetical protein